MTIYIIMGILLLGIIAYYFFRSKSKPVSDGYFVSTQSQSNERVKNLNLDGCSEDASYILDTNKLSFPDIKRENDAIEYKADPERELIIDLVQVNGDSFKKKDFTKMFDYEWRSKYPSTIYGFSADEKRWTYANAGGTPEIYTQLQVAINLQDVYSDENPNYDPKKIGRYIEELEQRIKKYPAQLKIEQRETVASAVIKAKKLVDLYQEFNRDAIIVLQNEKDFNGMEVWDALQSVGLTWGDGDLFHWPNRLDYGHDRHFSVWTTTDPGYFLPENIKDGTMNPRNLVFGFSIPRSADPVTVFEIMTNAVKYCQKRLGGQIVDRNMQLFDEGKEKQSLIDFLKKMEAKGIKAGSGEALGMF